ncbi:hypothetical protein [Tateyamaria pelophila]|uniref:hypothetical protein n=1 Tax=Tateyamaria pelophila TaxID=328415 RepID=UPI001CC050D8|nr:hypothetical protein [Tateyamaria pelophila]
MLPLYDITLLYHQPDHLTAPDPAERIAMAQIAPHRFKPTAWILAMVRAAFNQTAATRKA